MSDALDRGFTVTELASIGQPIDVERETVAAFLGRSLRGPVNEPVKVTSFTGFQRRFGGPWKDSELGPAVRQFFEHGGAVAYIVRLASKARGALLCLPAEGAALVLRAVEPGSTERIRAAVDYDGISDGETDIFNLTLQRIDPDTGLVSDQELYRRASIDADSPDYVVDMLLASGIARAQAPYPAQRPELTLPRNSVSAEAYVGHMQNGADGVELTDYDCVGSQKAGSALFALDALERFDLLYIAAPGPGRDLGPASILAADRYCRARGAMLIVDPAVSWESCETAIDGLREVGYSSPNMLSYFPRMRERDRGEGSACTVGGALAGLLCHWDRKHGAWCPVADNAMRLNRRFVPAASVDEDAARRLLRAGLNVIRPAQAGCAEFLAKVTLASATQAPPECTMLSVRRGILQLVAAVDAGTRWAVFAAEDEIVAGQVQEQVSTYLGALMGSGAFEENAHTVRCELTMSGRGANDLRIGIVIRPRGWAHALELTLRQSVRGFRSAIARAS